MTLATGRNVVTTAALTFALLLSGPARADEPKVEVSTEVILLSNQGNAIDPPRLAKLKDELAKAGRKFSSLKSLGQKKVAVQKNKPADVSLPDGRNATLKLLDIKDGAASINVSIPQKGRAPFTATYQAGPDPVLIDAGGFQTGKLLLVLTPPDGAQPRNALGGIKRRDLIPFPRVHPRAPALRPAVAPTK